MSDPNWTNQTMWTGDNLPIMRGMNSESVDLIYLDPPFNSNHDYAAPIGSMAAGAEFKDTWTLRDIDLAWLDLIQLKHPALNRVIDAAMIARDKSYLIYMAPRLLEMHRILKPTGSIYLHCDPKMSHYLKLLMDAIFGRNNFRNEIVWKRRQDTHNLATKTMGAAHDLILWYGDWNEASYNRQYMPYDESYLQSHYKYTDRKGTYRILPCTNETGGNVQYEFKGVYRAWRFSEETMASMYDDDRLVKLTDNGPYYYKKYLSDAKGVPIQDIWTDIPPVRGREWTGYPTQKPLALLYRIIQASTNPGDMVLDPFAGCATACVAAHNHVREWVGIDISSKASDLVKQRIADGGKGGLLYGITHRTDVPQRNDLGRISPANAPENKTKLYGEQEGHCAGCRTHFEARHLTVDHIIARTQGGTDHLDNLQLLCGHCNSVKGNRGMEYLIARLQDS